MHLNPYSSNRPTSTAESCTRWIRAPESLDLIAAHPDRTPYLERTTDPGFDDPVTYHDAPVPRVWLTQLQVLHGNAVTLARAGHEPT